MSIEDLELRNEQVELIKALKYSYFRACDSKDPTGFRESFVTNESEIDYGPLGTTDADRMCAIFREIALETNGDGEYIVLDMHHGLHPVITLTGTERATGNWTLRYRGLNLAERTETVLAGEYDDVYVVENGRWKIQRSAFRTSWRMVRPLPEHTRIEQ